MRHEVAQGHDFLNGREVHIWYTSTQASRETLGCVHQVLSSDEKDRAQQFRNAQDHNDYLVSHAVKRLILAEYTHHPASELRFSRTPFGKPYISSPPGSLEFNLTHTKNAVCFAIANHHQVGIDLEYINHDFEWHDIARVYFSAEENNQLQLSPDHEKVKMFFTKWTQKEALLKAQGRGLYGLNIASSDREETERDFAVISFQLPSGHQGAVAAPPCVTRLRFHTFSMDSRG